MYPGKATAVVLDDRVNAIVLAETVNTSLLPPASETFAHVSITTRVLHALVGAEAISRSYYRALFPDWEQIRQSLFDFMGGRSPPSSSDAPESGPYRRITLENFRAQVLGESLPAMLMTSLFVSGHVGWFVYRTVARWITRRARYT